MAVKAGTAYVDIEGDFSALNKQVASHFNRIGRNANKTGKKIGRSLGIGMAAGVGATVVAGKQLFDLGKDTVNIASDVNESLTKNQTLFGKYAKGIEDFAKRSGNAFGISRKSALEYTGTFGNLFNALGVSNKESAKFSTNLVKLAADMASFNNTSPEEALEAIRSGLVGETEPLRKFGVNMNDATLKAQAMRMGLIKNTKEALTPQTKALAAQALITKQTSAAHGDFAKTSDGLANSQRRLKARWEDMKGTLGDALLPAVKDVSNALLDIADDVQPKVERAIRGISRIFGRSDLSIGEKIQRSWDSLKLEFGPMIRRLADSLTRGMRDAGVGPKLKQAIVDATPVIASGFAHVGLKSAEVWWEAFKAAPLWAKVGSGVWIASKLGLTGPAFKGIFNLLSGKGGGLGGGGSLKPVPVFVENWKMIVEGSALGTGIAAGGVAKTLGKKYTYDPKVGTGGAAEILERNMAPAVVGGAVATKVATSFTSKLKALGPKLMRGAGWTLGLSLAGEMAGSLVGNTVGGQTGKKIETGLGRAAMWGGIGATAGSLIAPGIGTAVGGIGGAIIGGLSAALQKQKPTIEALAKKTFAKVPVDVQPYLPPDVQARIGKLQADIQKRQDDIASRAPTTIGMGRGGAIAKTKERLLKESKLTEADYAQIDKNAAELGRRVATSFTQAMSDQQTYFDAGHLTARIEQQFLGPLKGMPAEAKQAALDTMVQFGRTMEQEGRLPKGATAEMIRNIRNRFGVLPSFMNNVGAKSMRNLSAQLKKQDAVNAAQKQYDDIKRTWGAIPGIAKFTGQNTAQNFATEMGFLREKVANSTGKMKRKAQSDLKAIQDAAKKYGHGANTGLDAELQDMGIKGSRKARKLRDDVKRAFRNMATGVGGSADSANTALFNALENMGKNAAQIQKAMGLTPAQYKLKKAWQGAENVGTGYTPGSKSQRGTYVTGGKPVGDSVPILAERGEYVLNREAVKKVGKKHLDDLNYRTAPRFQTGGIVALGRRLQKEGYQVGENPAFGGVHPVHTGNSWHYKGLALDVNADGFPGGEPAALDRLYARLKRMPGIVELLWRVKDHFDHLHVAMSGAGGPLTGIPGLIEKVGRRIIAGPDSMIRDTAQKISDISRAAFNKYIADHAIAEGGEAGFVTGDTASGNGADLMRKISRARGWNFADWWEVDRRETGHGANLSNPTSSARLRGQFLDMNYGKYGPGSDPAQNPSMTQQIQSMAQYIASRYGTPTKALAFHRAHNYYRKGGTVKKTGRARGPLAKINTPKVSAKAIANLKNHKKHKPSDHISRAMIRSLGGAGAENLQAVMAGLKGAADREADWAQRANDITDTDALQNALNAQLATIAKNTGVSGLGSMTAAQLLNVFPAKDQDAFIQSWLRKYASVNGGNQTDHLVAELSNLLAWRNAIITNQPIFDTLKVAAEKAYKELQKELARLANDITMFEDRRDKARTRRDNEKQKLKDAREQLAADRKALKRERDKKQPKSRAARARKARRIERLEGKIAKDREKISDHRNKLRDAEGDIDRYNIRLRDLAARRKLARQQTQILGGDNGEAGDTGEGGRIGSLNDAITDMASSLIDVHGLGTTMQKFTSDAQFKPGVLGGTILGVQNEILGITRSAPRASAEDAAADPSTVAGADEIKDLIIEHQRQIIQRGLVRDFQSAVFDQFPFGGSFKEGGTVPGPVGAPRMILAHGGEYVMSNDEANRPQVSVNFANGMEWLKQFVDVRVDNQTRAQSRRGERQLPGRAGLLR